MQITRVVSDLNDPGLQVRSPFEIIVKLPGTRNDPSTKASHNTHDIAALR